MKNYTITVNGVAYDVTVEDKGGSIGSASAPVAAAPAAPANAGSIKVEAGAAGKIVKIVAPAGTAVKKGDAVIMIEAMKMEMPVAAPADGTVASINVNEGQQVEAGALLATLN